MCEKDGKYYTKDGVCTDDGVKNLLAFEFVNKERVEKSTGENDKERNDSADRLKFFAYKAKEKRCFEGP